MTHPQTSPPNADLLLDIARATVVRSTWEGRFSDYCHACSNRLNSLKLGLYLAQRQRAGRSDQLLEAARGHYDSLELLFEQFRTVCRPLKLSQVPLDLSLLIEDRHPYWSSLLAEHGVQLLKVEPARPVRAGLDVDRLAPALDGLIQWRCQFRSPGDVASIEWGIRAEPPGRELVYLRWEEYDSQVTRAATTNPGPRSAWPIAVLTRIVSEHGGSLSCQGERNWSVEIAWPSALSFA